MVTQMERCHKERVGRVVSDKAQKSITVLVERRTSHPVYGKSVLSSKKYLVHDEKNDARIGDLVRIRETRPLSKRKRFYLLTVLERNKRAEVNLAVGESVIEEFKKPKHKPVAVAAEGAQL